MYVKFEIKIEQTDDGDDGRHTIKNKDKIFKKHARVRRMDVREKQLVINQYVYFYYIVYIYMILNKYIVRYNMINV